MIFFMAKEFYFVHITRSEFLYGESSTLESIRGRCRHTDFM